MGTATLAARTLLALVFATAAVAKLREPSSLLTTFGDFGVNGWLARAGAAALAPAELAIALGLMFVPSVRWAAAGAIVLLLVFMAGIGNALRQGLAPDCGCFGSLRPEPITPSTLIRNAGLLVVAVFAAISAPGPGFDHWVASSSPAQLLAGLIAVIGVAAGIILRPLVRVRSGKAAVISVGATLKVGQNAPSFRLEDSRGQVKTLSSISTPGRPLVLVFGSSTCGACVSLFPHLGRWHSTLSERVDIAVIARADTEGARQISGANDLPEVLADPTGDAFDAYGIVASPLAVSLTPDGRIANGPAVGQDAIEELIRLTLHRSKPTHTEWMQTTRAA